MIASPPLTGQRVLVTRPVRQAERFRIALEAVGADVTVVPTIRVGPPSDTRRLGRAARTLETYDWVVVTSVNAVERLASALEAVGAADGLRRRGVAAIGPATGEAVRALGCPECLVPTVYRGEALAESIIAATPADRRAGVRILIAQAETARAVLRNRLIEAGAVVDVAPAYSVEVNWAAQEKLLEFIEWGKGDWLTFTAASAVRAFVELAGAQTGGASVAAISPVTAAAVAELGLPIHAVASDHSAPGLVDALIEAVRARMVPKQENGFST